MTNASPIQIRRTGFRVADQARGLEPGITWYDVLGAVPDAPTRTIKRKYQDKAALLRPELISGAPSNVLSAVTRAQHILDAAWGVLGEPDRRKRLEKEEKDREEDRKFVLEVADAFNFRLIGSEAIDGRDTWVFEGEPRPDYQPKSREAKILGKFKGRVWIDKADSQWVKLDITAIDSISVGWFLARIRKGMHIEAEQTKINDEVWLPKHVAVRVDARLALLKSYNEDVDETFRDYKKFRTESKITAVGETQ